jgi:hypothetical protein
MSPRSPSQAPLSTTAVEIEALFQRSTAVPNWRTIAIKHALLELASTLSSVLSSLTVRDRRGQAVLISLTEERLLQLIPALIEQAVRVQHLDQIVGAIQRLALGHTIDLLPLVQAAIADLAAVDSSQRVAATTEESL